MLPEVFSIQGGEARNCKNFTSGLFKDWAASNKVQLARSRLSSCGRVSEVLWIPHGVVSIWMGYGYGFLLVGIGKVQEIRLSTVGFFSLKKALGHIDTSLSIALIQASAVLSSLVCPSMS